MRMNYEKELYQYLDKLTTQKILVKKDFILEYDKNEYDDKTVKRFRFYLNSKCYECEKTIEYTDEKTVINYHVYDVTDIDNIKTLLNIKDQVLKFLK